MTTFPLFLMQRDRFVFSAWIVTYPKAVVLSKSLATEKRKVLVKVFFFSIGSLVKRAIFFAPVKVKYEKKKEKKKETSLWETYLPVPWSYRVFSHDVTAAILVSQNNETAAMLVSQPVLWELSSFLMQTLSFVSINLLRCCMAAWVKTLYTGQLFVPTRNEWMIKHYTLNVRCRGKQFCLPESPDVFRDKAEGNIRTRGKTKLTGFPRDLTLSVLLYF